MWMGLWSRRLIQWSMMSSSKRLSGGPRPWRRSRPIPSTSSCCPSSPADSVRELTPNKSTKPFAQTVSSTKTFSTRSVHLSRPRLMCNPTSPVIIISKPLSIKSNRPGWMWGFGKQGMGWRITFSLCDISSYWFYRSSYII